MSDERFTANAEKAIQIMENISKILNECYEKHIEAVGYPFPVEDIEDERYRLECELDQLTLEVVPEDHYVVIWYSKTDMPKQESFPTFAAACEFDERLSDCGVITSGVMGGMD